MMQKNHLRCDMHNGIRVYKHKKYHNKLKKGVYKKKGNLEPCHYNFAKFEIYHRYLNDI